MRTATVAIDSTKVPAEALARLEVILYGTDDTPPRLPLPDEIFAIFNSYALVEKPNDPGVFYILNDFLTEKPNDPGVFTVNGGLTEKQTDPGVFKNGAQ